MENDTNQKPPREFAQFYGTLTLLAIHGQENKWWMLYIFLVFNSILVLSCSTVLVAQTYLPIHPILVSVFCLAGLIANILWLLMAKDYIAASNRFTDIAKEAENWMPKDLRKPWQERDSQRKTKNPLATMAATSYTLASIFIVTYIIAATLAWVRFGCCLHALTVNCR